jgi:hypothetical protein
MVNGNVISSLEQSLQQIQQLLSQKKGRLREIEREADDLHAEVSKLKDSEEQIKKMMRSLLDGGQTRKSAPSRAHELDDLDISDYDDLYDEGEDEEDLMPRYAPQKRNTGNYPSNNYSHRSVVPMHRQQNNARNDIPSVNPEVEVKNYRFRDRTIASACTMLMREYGRPLHVNEIYNRLLEGGMTFTGNNPTISIAVSLNRNRRFRKVAPGTFDLVMRDASQAAS